MSWAKYRLWCVTEAKMVYVWSPTVPTVCPNNAAHTIDEDSITLLEYGKHAGTSQAFDVHSAAIESDVYQTVYTMTYNGGFADGWPVKASFLVKTANAAGDNGSIRIQDTTNNTTICEITGINSVDFTEVVTEAISNLVNSGSVTWEVQIKTESGEAIWLDSFTLSF